MKPTVNQFCWLASVRTGCIVIALFLIINAVGYLLGYVFRNYQEEEKKPSGDNADEKFLLKYGEIISLSGSVVSIIIGAIILIAVFKMIPVLLKIATWLLLLYTIFFLLLSAWLIVENAYLLCFVFLICSLLHLYFTLVVYSYNEEMKFEQVLWEGINLTYQEYRERMREERRQRREQSLQAKHYRAPVEDDTPP